MTVDEEIADLARQIALPVEPLEYEVHATDEAEAEWWYVDPLDEDQRWRMPGWARQSHESPPDYIGGRWESLAVRARAEAAFRDFESRAIDLPPDWWAGCLEGLRIGLEIARAERVPAVAAEPRRPRPVVEGRRMRRCSDSSGVVTPSRRDG